MFVQESLIPVMDMFLLELQDKQVMRPILYIDYMVMSPPSRTVRGEGIRGLGRRSVPYSSRRGNGADGGRVEAMTLGPVNVPPVSAPRPQPERAVTQGVGRPIADRYQGKNGQKILSLSGLSVEKKPSNDLPVDSIGEEAG